MAAAVIGLRKAADDLQIRRYVTAIRRAFPEADLEGYADRAILEGISAGDVAAALFDVMAAAQAERDKSVPFRRVPLLRVLGAKRKALS